LALQSTLSDVFSGIVLNFSRPYRPGDWISIDGSTDGRVIEMNWRATHVLTGKSDLAIVPNSTIAKAKIVNTSSLRRVLAPYASAWDLRMPFVRAEGAASGPGWSVAAHHWIS